MKMNRTLNLNWSYYIYIFIRKEANRASPHNLPTSGGGLKPTRGS